MATRRKPTKKRIQQATSPKRVSANPVSVTVHTLVPAERVQLDKAGRIVVPARFRKALGVERGETLTMTLEGDALKLQSVRSALGKARALMRKKNPQKRSLVDELVAERRAEATKE